MSMVEIKPRNIKFALTGEDKRNWFAGDPVATAMLDGSSVLFPIGETFFIQSVIYFRDRISDPKLLADITGFQQQEGIHSREHRRYNKAIEAFGGNVAELEGRLQAEVDKLERDGASPEYKLALTCAFEHFTAMLAEHVLEHPEFLEGAEPEFARIWKWHAIEEAEHKSVAFDVWNQVKPKGLKGYLMRVRAMFKATSVFVGQSRYNAKAFLRARGYGGARHTVLGILRFSLISPGVLLKTLPDYLAYFKPGYHPWQKDTRHLIEKYKSAYEA